jgi:hypothetical protein
MIDRIGLATATACVAGALAIAATSMGTSAAAMMIGVPQRANANVSIAAEDAFVAMVWSASASTGATDVFAALSRDGGRTFGSPVRVNDVTGDARVTGEQPPRVSLVHQPDGAPRMTIVWTAKGPSGTTLEQAQSTDSGRTFSRATIVPGSDAPGNRGWEAISAGERGVDALWLDHRELAEHAAQMPTMHHETGGGKPDGVAMAQRSKLYFAALDGSIPPHAITGGVCYCCKTALVSAGGVLYAAWRHVYPGNIRDIAFTLSRDGGRTFAAPVRVSEDKWVLEGCPDDGPSMAVARDHRIHIVWPTLLQEDGKDPNLALFYATSTDGRSFTPRERVPTSGTPHHPQIALDAGGGLVVVWDELESGRRHVAMARLQQHTAGNAMFSREVISDGEPAMYPVVARAADGVVVAWTSGAPAESMIRVARVAAASASTAQ